jgi:hydroxyquinol 1,2-dioxygenase
MTAATKRPAGEVTHVYDTTESITEEVLARYARTPDPRLREIMLSLIKHLHAFARDVNLTWKEWEEGLDFLYRTGEISGPGRNEFIILSDTLGLTMLTATMDKPTPPEATTPTLIGPFFIEHDEVMKNGEDISRGAAGDPFYCSGRVLDLDGKPVAGATVDVWHSDERGLYDVQTDFQKDGIWARGRFHTDKDGKFSFWSVRPVSYPVPSDGTAGLLIRSTTGEDWRPAHLHVRVEAKNFDTLITHLFPSGDPYLDRDAVFGVRPSLIVDYVRNEPGTAPDGTKVDKPFYTLDYDFVMTRPAAQAAAE